MDKARIGSEVDIFKSKNNIITVSKITEDTCTITTKNNNTYTLTKHNTLNYYYGVCNGYKVHCILKKNSWKSNLVGIGE